MFAFLSTARDLGRMHEIARVLVRHGLGDLVGRLGIAGVLQRAGRAVRWKGSLDLVQPPEARVRQALEELGPTFVKLGQILAGRSDLLPREWTDELSKLHAHAAAVPFDELRVQLAEDLDRDPDAEFARIDPEPLAAASIAQVHRATTRDGREVVLKMRRPGIRAVVDADLRLCASLARQAEQRVPELRGLRPEAFVRELSRSLRSELDLRIEAKNLERMRANLPPDSRLSIPAHDARLASERLLVMDYLPGPDLGSWLRLPRADADPDPRELAAIGAEAVLRMVFVDGLFHADPHPGNVLVLPDGRLGLIDFGMVGSLSDERRREFVRLLHAVARRDVDEAVDVLSDWGGGDVDPDLLRADCGAFVDRYHGLPLSRIDAAEMLHDVTALLRENGLFLPPDVAMLIKVFLTLDSLGRRLDPEFVTAIHVEPFAERVFAHERSPLVVARRGARGLAAVLATLPRDLSRLSSRLRRGRLAIDVDTPRLDAFGHTLERSANRLTIGVVTAALIVGTSIALTVPGGPQLFGQPAFALIGFLSSLATGLWLIVAVMRTQRD